MNVNLEPEMSAPCPTHEKAEVCAAQRHYEKEAGDAHQSHLLN